MDTPRNTIRIDSVFFMDAKYRQLFREPEGYAATILHFALIALSSQTRSMGRVSDVDIETAFDNIRAAQDIRPAVVELLLKYGLLVGGEDGEYLIPNFEKWQFPAKQAHQGASSSSGPGYQLSAPRPQLPESLRLSDEGFDREEGFKDLMAAWVPAPGRFVHRHSAYAAYAAVVSKADEHAAVMKGVRGYNFTRKSWAPEMKDKVMNLDNWLKAERFLTYDDPPPEPSSATVNNPRAPKGMDVMIPDDE